MEEIFKNRYGIVSKVRIVIARNEAIQSTKCLSWIASPTVRNDAPEIRLLGHPHGETEY